MILSKEMKKLYLNKYQYKIVLVLDAAWAFRGNNLERAKEHIYDFRNTGRIAYTKIADTELVLNLIDVLESIEDYTVRVERCYLSLYFTDERHIRTIKKLMKSHVREIYTPSVPLTEGTVVSSLPYDYKVHAKINLETDYSGFIEWAEKTDKVRLPKSAKLILSKEYYYGSTGLYFYIKGEQQLTLAKLHLGSGIKKIERIINP